MLEDYTKYRLKDREQLQALLAPADRLFLITCGKCFREFDPDDDHPAAELMSLAEELGKTVVGHCRQDFLCNAVLTQQALRQCMPEDCGTVVAAACGVGIQTAAAALSVPVIAAADTVSFGGHHGMALTDKRCGACAQCYLNLTGGICPVTDCAKSLLNGQCGGAKDGKCEKDPARDCAWEKISRRLKLQGREDLLRRQPVQLRDYSKNGVTAIRGYVQAVRESRTDGFYGGVHPWEGKELAAHKALTVFPAPETVILPMSLHAGAPAEPVVQVGDYVYAGQLIGKPTAFISSPVHASVSGVVEAVEARPHGLRGTCPAVVIRSDGKNLPHPHIRPEKPLEELTGQEIVDIVRKNGIVGMGGAAFPMAVKLTPAGPIDAVLLNGCECEPLLTADHQLMLHYPGEILYGLRAMMKAVGAPEGYVAVEDNKPDAIALLQQAAADLEHIHIVPIRTKYPQGAEKMLIWRILGRQVPSGGLPADVGAVVGNVSTAKAIADAILTGMPPVERITTVTGPAMASTGNFLVKLGTPVRALIDHCGGVTDAGAVIKLGGPMMGTTVTDPEVPVMKATNGIIAVLPENRQEGPCIRCGRCVDVCPMKLAPLQFARYAREENWEAMKAQRVMDCMECRCCSYICSAGIPLLDHIRAGKQAVRGMK